MSSAQRLIAFSTNKPIIQFFTGKRLNYRATRANADESSEAEEETVSSSEQNDKQEGVQFDRPAAGCDLPNFYIHISDESD